MTWVFFFVLILVVVFAPSLWVKWVMHKYAGEIDGMPGTGGELAQHLIDRFELAGVNVETTKVGDHYDPTDKTVRLLAENFDNKSLTAVAIAAHEVGHAIQDHESDKRLEARTRLIPIADQIARWSVRALWAAPIVGLLTRHPVPFSLMVAIGLTGFIGRMLVHVVTLPIEFDASFAKALPILIDGKYIAPGEEVVVHRILKAAAYTYVAAALADVLNLARWAAILLRR
jgi:Zn-dependent membrane protease YugP